MKAILIIGGILVGLVIVSFLVVPRIFKFCKDNDGPSCGGDCGGARPPK
jgi:hypothetical protein